MTEAFEIRCPVAKLDPDQRIVWGWASVARAHGAELVDAHGDIIDMAELQKAAHRFMAFYRTGGAMHSKLGVGVVVDSIVLTQTVQKALGIELDREGWFIGMYVADVEAWEAVKSGRYTAFSIGGAASREPIQEGAP